MSRSKRIIALVLTFLMVLTTTSVMAQDNNNGRGKYTDVDDNHWAKEYIELMSELGIINGYGDETFKPADTVSRAEFAKMMVLTMNLPLKENPTPTFIDVVKGDWEFPFVETAKGYLTGYTSVLGLKFKPDNNAVREDMAVAIVKGLGITPSDDLSPLEGYTDVGAISNDLKVYVAAAIKEGIMIGSGTSFSPQGQLTRAEAATLLARLIVEEKIVLDDDTKVVIDDFKVTTNTPKLVSAVVNGQVVLEWSKVNADKFKYYKVSISEENNQPNYPNVGSFVPVSGVTNTRYTLKNGMSHSNLVLKGGASYYVAITAVYPDDKYYTSNVVKVTIPGNYVEPDEGSRTPVLDFTVRSGSGDVVLDWSNVDSTNFSYYKVVASLTDSAPMYPEDGYFKALSGTDNSRWELATGAKNNQGLVLEAGKTYYVAITAVYGDSKYSSNVVRVTMPAAYVEPGVGDKTPTLRYDLETKGVELKWTQVPSSGFNYYKVVLSKTKENPYYPDYGYLTYISDASQTSFFVQQGQGYNDGNKGGIGGAVKNEKYYMTITAVFDSGKYTSNTVIVTVPSK